MLKLAHFFYYISIDIPYLENNSFMDYSDIFNFFIPILIIVLILIVFIKMPLNIILMSKVVNEDIKISLNLRYLFNIININIPIYPRKAKSKKKEIKSNKKKALFKKNIKDRKILLSDFLYFLKSLKAIEIEEFYSDIEIGNTNISITVFAYLCINLIYGNLINIIDPNKFYMNIKPNFIENNIYIDFKIHIKQTIKDSVNILKAIFILVKNSKKIKKEDTKYESSRFNTKYNGNNA